MKNEHEKISRLIIYSPFFFMVFIILTISVVHIVYNYNEYTSNTLFQTQEHTKFLGLGIEQSAVDASIDRQRQHIIEKTQQRTLYSIGVMIVAVLLGAFFMHVIFRKIILKSMRYHRALIYEKEKIATMSNELKVANERLEYQLYIDNLTKLGNRQALEKDIALMTKPKLILLDIDSFKSINEYYGTSVGDFILNEVGHLLESFVEDKKIKVYRVGADEFALLEDADLDVERYEGFALSLVTLFKGRMLDIPFLHLQVELNIAIGFSLDNQEVFEKASMALEEAKKREIDYLCYFKKIERTTLYAEQIKWSNFIKEAIQNDNIMPYYQPIFDTHNRIVKYECLVRLLNEREEAIPPGLFLNISKRVKKYTDIEKLLIDKSFKEISGTDKIISINLLARDMSDSNISNYVVEKLKEYNVSKQVVFEILEDESIENLDRVEIFIDRVKRMGCKIAIDDFGTGYSNFSYLLKLKPDYIKIDGSLIKNLDKDEKSMAIVSAIIIFARKLGIKTIAEYVHSKQVFDICLELGINEFQGFYLAEPSAKMKII